MINYNTAIKNNTSHTIALITSLWSLLKNKRKKQLVGLIFIMILNGIAEIISLGSLIPFISLVTKPEIINEGFSGNFLIKILNFQTYQSVILFFTFLFTLAVVLSSLTRLLNLYLTEKMVALIGNEFSCQAFEKTIYQPFNIHIGRNSSEVLKSITIQIDNTINVINSFLKMIASLVIFIFIFSFLLYTDWKISLIILLSLAFNYSLISFLSRKILIKNSVKVNQLRFEQIKIIQEGLGSIRDLIINMKQPEYSNYYNKVDIPLRNGIAKNRLLINSPKYLIEGLSLLLLSFLTYFLIISRNDSTMVIPLIASFALGAQKMLPSIQQIFKSWGSIKSYSSDIKSVINLLNQPIQRKEIIKKIRPIDFQKIIFEKVSFTYCNSSKYALKDINIEIKKGDIIGIVGKTGSGKSTFIDLFIGLLSPVKGKVFLNDFLFKNDYYLKQSFYSIISHVPQDIFLSDLSIAENIAFGIKKENINFKLLESSAKRSQLFDFISFLPNGFNTIVGERGINLSGGQKQRIAIARAFYKNSSIIVFDEATSALDNNTEKLIMDSFRTMGKDITVLLVAHRISSLKNCSRIFRFDNGKLIEVLEQFDINSL